MAIEEPRYRLIDQDGNFSRREYAPVIVAETDVDGSLDHASSAGFRRLAGYIFGQKIAMTAPVTAAGHDGGWRVTFTMPARYTLTSLPLPDDPQVRLRAIPGETMAVIRFSGLVNGARIAARTADLRAWMADHRIQAVDTPRLARYDPPWTLPFLRRNEILIPYR